MRSESQAGEHVKNVRCQCLVTLNVCVLDEDARGKRRFYGTAAAQTPPKKTTSINQIHIVVQSCPKAIMRGAC